LKYFGKLGLRGLSPGPITTTVLIYYINNYYQGFGHEIQHQERNLPAAVEPSHWRGGAQADFACAR
jgi:hypothetical protein